MKSTIVRNGQTSIVRHYVREHYVNPARREGRRTFRVVVGDVHKAVGLTNRVPLVCNALSSKKFLQENSLRLVGRSGPPSGQSTTVILTYEVIGNQNNDPMESLRLLRGAGAKIFADLGGGESFLRGERSTFSAALNREKL